MVDAVKAEVETWPEIAVWNLVFLDHPREHWWDWLTEARWRHVCAFGYANGRWVVYDVADVRSCILVLTGRQFDIWVEARRERITDILQVPVANTGDLRTRLGLWCVTAVKHLAGIRSSALRPKALHRDLTRLGCKRLLHGRQGPEDQGK